MKEKFARSKNFTLTEIAHRPLLSDPSLQACGMYQMGKMQAIRNFLCGVYDREVKIIITSGYRELEYNRSIGSPDTSNHVWRIEDGRVRAANDFYCYIGFERADILDIFKDLEPFWDREELYLNLDQQIIHVGSQPWDKPSWFRADGIDRPISEL